MFGVYACSGGSVLCFSDTGNLLNSIPRPGESADDVDVEIAPETLTVGSTIVPKGQLLFINGETNTADRKSVV